MTGWEVVVAVGKTAEGAVTGSFGRVSLQLKCFGTKHQAWLHWCGKSEGCFWPVIPDEELGRKGAKNA